MVKTIVIPHNNILNISIPTKYIGREIEVIVYAKDEILNESTKTKKTFANFTGILTESEYQSLKNQTEQARKEWSRDI